MDYRIEKKNTLKVFGYESIISEESAPKHYKYPGLMWKDVMSDGRFDKLANDTLYKEHPEFKGMCRVHAILNYEGTPKDTFSYMIGAFVGDNSKIDGYDVVDIPKATYAVFPSGEFNWDEIGTVVGNLLRRINDEWLPTSSYQRADGAEFEIYGGSEAIAEIEIWIPVCEK